MKTHFQLSKIAAALTVVGGVSLFSGQAMATTPLAGTNISNVATATYTDNTGTERVVTSNEVKTIVSQVGSLKLETSRSGETTPNGKVEMSHILTNTGNGTDKFKIDLINTLEDGSFEFENGKFAVYIDRNKDGVPDNAENLNGKSVELKAGEDIGLIVVATTPNTAIKDQKDTLTLTVTAEKASLYLESTDTNVDTVKIVDGAVVTITKAANKNTAKIGDLIEYTLTFKNTGNAVAEHVAIFDVLPNNIEYVEGSAKYSASANPLNDEENTEDNYRFFDLVKDANGKVTQAARVLLNIPVLNTNTTGTLKFTAKVLSSSASSINNTAYADPDGDNKTPYDEDNLPKLPNPPTSTPTGSTPSNESKVTLVGSYDSSITDSETVKIKDTAAAVAPEGFDSIVVEGKQGIPVVFGQGSEPIYVHNLGDRVDTYNLTINKDAFAVLLDKVVTEIGTDGKEVSKTIKDPLTQELPTGSIVEILKADGATPVTDTNGDGVLDTGPIVPGTSAQFIVRVTLPNGTVIKQELGGIGIKLESTSITNGYTDTLKLITSTMLKNSVDLTSKTDKNGEKGQGSPNDKDYQTKFPNELIDQKSTQPGSPINFDITITNQGNVPDNYIITVPNVPEDWTVDIFEKNGDVCTTTKVTNSGNIKPTESKSFCVTVTPPAGTPAGTDEDIKVEISSPATGTKDNIKFEVLVEEQRGLSFTPNRQGQVAPGGTVEYVHTLKNVGNVTEGAPATKADSEKTAYDYPLNIDWSLPQNGENISIYAVVINEEGEKIRVLVTGNNANEWSTSLDKILSDHNGKDGLKPNESIDLVVKVEASANATAGEKYTSLLTITPTGTDGNKIDALKVSITDLTTVNLGQVRLVKTQTVGNCDPKLAPTVGYVMTNIQAKPGECVYYSITATNDGNVNAESVMISDMVPSYTSYIPESISPAVGQIDSTTNEPVVGTTKAPTTTDKKVKYNVGTLSPAQTTSLKFAVKVDGEIIKSETSVTPTP